VGWVYVFAVLEVLAVALAIVDVIAVRRKVGRALPKVSLGMKASVVLAFLVWWLYFNFIAQGTTMEDLAAFAGILVVSVPVLLVSVVLDIMTVRALAQARKGS
jgi:hypothetical protein